VDDSLAEWRTEEHSARREVEDAGGGSGLVGKWRTQEEVLGSPVEGARSGVYSAAEGNGYLARRRRGGRGRCRRGDAWLACCLAVVSTSPRARLVADWSSSSEGGTTGWAEATRAFGEGGTEERHGGGPPRVSQGGAAPTCLR
jgi:hypothetical protein